jgi:hypothetical protein
MSELLLIPGLISLFLVAWGRIETAFLSIYLPCLLCLPDDYRLRIPHLPPTSVAEFALLPLGAVALYRFIRKGSFALMDLLVPLYTTSIGLSEILHGAVLNDGIFAAMGVFISTFLAYIAGRALIEPELRVATVRRFVSCVLFDGIPGIWEWRMGQSLYGIWGIRFFGVTTIEPYVQLRNGFGRMGSVFNGGEPGGIAFAMTFCLNSWLVYLRRVKPPVDLGKWLTRLESYHVAGFLLICYVLMAQSRGPQIALAAGFVILQIPRFKNTRMMTIVCAVLLIGGYLGAQAFFDSYMKSADPSAMTEQQGSVMYRRTMNELYPPIAEKGGWTGYSVLGIPHVPGMPSIDNHYLLVHLAWGRLGYYCLILIVWENIRVLLLRSWQVKAFADRAFVFSMLAAMAVLWFTLLTVFMGGQLPQITFLLIGWMQSTGERREEGFSFQRVFS